MTRRGWKCAACLTPCSQFMTACSPSKSSTSDATVTTSSVAVYTRGSSLTQERKIQSCSTTSCICLSPASVTRFTVHCKLQTCLIQSLEVKRMNRAAIFCHLIVFPASLLYLLALDNCASCKRIPAQALGTSHPIVESEWQGQCWGRLQY